MQQETSKTQSSPSKNFFEKSCVQLSCDSNVAFDSQNQQFIYSEMNAAIGEYGNIHYIDDDGNRTGASEFTLLNQSEKQASNCWSEELSDEADLKKRGKQYGYADNWSILRFVKSNKSKELEISPSGIFYIVYNPNIRAYSDYCEANNAQQESTCERRDEIGVYNPLTKKELLTQFKTTTPRVITVCLDLNDGQLKFWLNDRRNSSKTIKLQTNDEISSFSGPWIPCVKLGKEKNKIILNPFAREPSDFYEKDFDKKFNQSKYLFPFLHNMLLIHGLQLKSKTSKELSQELKDLCSLTASKINNIFSPSNLLSDSPDTPKRFCFVQFNHYSSVVEFIEAYSKSDKFSIVDTSTLVSWFEKKEEDISHEMKLPFKLIKEYVKIPNAEIGQVMEAANCAFEEIFIEKEQVKQGKKEKSFNITHQPFSDKLIAIKDQKIVKAISRDQSTNEFELETVNFSESPLLLNSEIMLTLKASQFKQLFSLLNWSQMLKDKQPIVNGILSQFFNSVRVSAVTSNGFIKCKSELIVAKLFVEMGSQQARSQLDRIRRSFNNYASIVNGNSIINRKTEEDFMEELNSYKFCQSHNHSVDELYYLLNILNDLNEQIWAKSRWIYCPPIIKDFMNSVSRPFSALNRLGSFIQWGIHDLCPLQLSNNGMYYKETQTVTQFSNQQVEIQDLSLHNLTDYDLLQSQLGGGNRYLKALISENIPLSRSLNYLPSNSTLQNNTISHVISSQNSGYVLLGTQNGMITISNSLLDLTELKQLSFFTSDLQEKQTKFSMILKKMEDHRIAFHNYKQQVLKRSAILSIAKDFTPISYKPPLDKNEKISKSSKKKLLKELKMSHVKQAKAKAISGTSDKISQFGKGKKKGKKSKGVQSIELKEEKKEEQKKEEEKKEVKVVKEASDYSQCKVIGYVLLSKPAFDKVIDPIYVGCVYFNGKTQEYFLKVRKIIFMLHYLLFFITIDPNSGQQVNGLTGKQMTESSELDKFYKEVLNNSDISIDLYSVFLRNQVLKKEWPKNNEKFQVLTDIAEQEILIDNCQSVIDITSCEYQIENSKTISILVKSNDNQTVMKQYIINEQQAEEKGQKDLQFDFTLTQNNDRVLDTEYLRIFQVDEKVLLVGENQYKVTSQNSETIHQQVQLKTPITQQIAKQITISNKSDQSKLFCRDNLKKYFSKSEVPPQDWTMILDINGQIEQYPLNEPEVLIQKQKTIKVSNFDLSQLTAADLMQIGNLLESKYLGTIGMKSNQSELTSSCLDVDVNLFSHHSWHITDKQERALQFSIKIPQKYQSSQMRLIDIEISFKKKKAIPLPLKGYFLQQRTQDVPDFDQKSLKRIPLVVESFVGAQISDTIQPSFLINPDNTIFNSNYSLPEFVFKHYQGKGFVPNQFVVRSKENRMFNGFPIAQGVIFMADTIEELQNTKQFSRFTSKDYKQWKAKRDMLGLVPLLPNEPVAFFDLEDQNEIVINLQNVKPCRFVKFIPTAYRKFPINFTHKAFNAEQVECQFFGVNGTEITSKQRGESSQSGEYVDKLSISELKYNLQCSLKEKSLGVIGEIDSMTISEIRSAKSSNSSLPVLALSDLKNHSIVGVARAQILVKEEHCDSIRELIMEIGKEFNENSIWEVSGVGIAVKAFSDESVRFQDTVLEQNKSKMREYLLDNKKFHEVLKQLLDIVQSKSITDESIKLASLQSILKYLSAVSLNKNKDEFLSFFKSNTQIDLLFTRSFIESSQSFQNQTLRYLEEICIIRNESKFLYNYIQDQLEKFLQRSWSSQSLQFVFDLLQYCTNEDRFQIQQRINEILFKVISKSLIPKYQSEEYILLRSKLNLDQFPFDNKQIECGSGSKQIDGDLTQLPCSFEISKVNTFYCYNVDFKKTVAVDKMMVFFELESKSLYKISVKVLVPDVQGQEQIHLMRLFEENAYSQVCDRGHRQVNVKYFNHAVGKQDEREDIHDEEIAQEGSDQLSLNALTIELNGVVGRYLKIQVELVDSYRTLAKPTTCPQILIHPEFFGQVVDAAPGKVIESFKIGESQEKYLMKTEKIGNSQYKLYQIHENALSASKKALLFEMPQKKSMEEDTKSEEEVKGVIETLNSKRKELKDLLEEQIIGGKLNSEELQTQNSQIITLSTEIESTKSQIPESTLSQLSEDKLSLSYLYTLFDILSYHVLASEKLDSQILNDYDGEQLYKELFTLFVINDSLRGYSNISKLLKLILSKIQDKSKFKFSILSEFVFNTDKLYNQQNVISFIQTSQFLVFNDLLDNYLLQVNYSSEFDLQSITSSEDLNKIIVKSRESEEIKMPIVQMFTLMKLVDEMKYNESSQQVRVDLLWRLVAHFGMHSQYRNKQQNDNVQLVFQYAITVLSKLHSLPQASLSQMFVPNSTQISLLLVFKICIQLGNKNIDKLLKQLLSDLIKQDLTGQMSDLFSLLSKWFNNKDYTASDPLYSVNSPIQHQTLSNKLYLKVLEQQNGNQDKSGIYKELGETMLEMLNSMSEGESDKQQVYLWIQLYQNFQIVDLQTIVKRKYFELMAVKFYKLQKIDQETLYPKFHSKSQKMLFKNPSHHKVILQIAKSFLFEGFKNHSTIPLAYCLCDGLFNLIQSGKKEQSLLLTKTVFDVDTISELMNILSEFISIHLNYQVYSGVTGANIEVVMKLDMANQLSNMMVNANNLKGDIAFEEYVNVGFIAIKNIKSILEWLFLNVTQKGKVTPACEKAYLLSSNLEVLMKKLSENQDASCLVLMLLMETILKVDDQLRVLTKNGKINQFRAVSMQKSANSLFLALFDSWVSTNFVAKCFLTDLNGFDFLLDRLFFKRDAKSQISSLNLPIEQEDETNSLIESIKLKLNKGKEKEKPEEKKVLPTSLPPISKKQTAIIPSAKFDEDPDYFTSQTSKDIEQQMQLEDFGRSMKLIWTSDKEKAVASTYATLQWNKFKNGQKNRIYNVQLTDPSFEYEYSMVFDLEKLVQLSEIQFGILYNWTTYDPDTQYEPLSLILDGGLTRDTVDWSVVLDPIKDGGYQLNSVTVYGRSFIEGKSVGDKLEKVIQDIGTREARYLTFKFRKPIIACVENSMMISSLKKVKSYGVIFISVNGTTIDTQNVYSYLIDQQKDNSLEILSKFFQGEFTDAFEFMASQSSIIEKIKGAFDRLSILLDNKAALVKPIFLSICSKNKDFSNWLMTERLISLNSSVIKKEQIKFLGDIISSQPLSQLEKLKLFLFDQVDQCKQGTLQLSADQQTLFSRFINLFCSKLRAYASTEIKEQVLEFTKNDLENIVSVMQSCQAGKSKLFISLTRLALLLLIPPFPFVNETISTTDYVELLLQSEDQQFKLQYLLFSTIIASTNEETMVKIMEKGNIEWVMEQLLMQKEGLQGNEVYQLIQILYNCTKQKVFKDKYRSTLTSKLYNIVKNSPDSDKMLRSDSGSEHIELLVQTIKDLAIGDDEEEEKITTCLKEDILLAAEKSDVNFINQVLVPILHAEENIAVTIGSIEEGSRNQGVNPIFSASDVESSGMPFFLKTEILSDKQKKSLGAQFKSIAGDHVEGFSKLANESKWDMIFQGKTTGVDSSKFRQFVTATSNKQNVFILVQCNLNGSKAVLGGFCHKPFPALGESWAHEFDYQIPFGEGNFVFYYTPEKELHFTMQHNKPFGYIYTDYEEGGALSISGDFFLVSWSYEFNSSCGNIYDMKCVEEPTLTSFYSNMEITNCEIWWANPNEKTQKDFGKVKHELKKHRFYKSYSPYNFFRENLVFEVNKGMLLSTVADEITGSQKTFINYPGQDEIKEQSVEMVYNSKANKQDPILDLVCLKKQKEIEQKKENEEVKEITLVPIVLQKVVEKDKLVAEELKQVEVKDEVIEQSIDQPILRKFEKKGGIYDLIKAGKSAVMLYKNDKLKEMWGLWLTEIESFSQLPGFFSQFCQDRNKEQIVYSLIDGRFDKQIEVVKESEFELQKLMAEQESLHIDMVKYSYKIVNEVFEKYEGSEFRDQCMKNGTIQKFIERIGQLSGEKKRSHGISPNHPEDKISPSKLMEKSDTKSIDDPYKKRKGVGYTTGTGTQWNVTEYLKSKEAKSSQGANIVNILRNVMKSKDWEVPTEFKDLILESALLPTLESAFRSGSLLEMAKEYDLNMAYLNFVLELANHDSLVDLLQNIGSEYLPVQKESVSQLLHKIGELSSIFLACLTTDSKEITDGDQAKPKHLAEKILETSKAVEDRLALHKHTKEQQSLEEILSMPLSEAYFKLLSKERFQYMSMKDSSGIYQHVYNMEIIKNSNPPTSKLVRLAQEIADLSNSLPCDYMNGVFCRVDKERVDLMKCCIMGASGTPYAHGAFIYDLFFENNYPQIPPKCQLVTTGGQTVRFNPNLYNNGKVCLSLLGTWRGSSTENWDAKFSTILQVLLSIQAIIMSNEVYFNEPGYEHEAGTPEGEKKNEGYANIVRYCNVKFAIIDAIKNPPKGFEKVIRNSFYLKKNEVLREVKEWVDRAKTTEALYVGLVYDHNYTWAPQISPPGKYAELMENIFKELQETLDSLKSPFEDEETGEVVERKFSDTGIKFEKKKEEKLAVTSKFQDIDVSYEPAKEGEQQSMNINDEKVKDRWSRYIGAMGIEAVAKQAESRVLIVGLGPLGIEIAKNIILAGCKELIILDNKTPTFEDISGGQFFLSEKDIEDSKQNPTKSRAQYCKEKLQQLNYYVKLTVLPFETNLLEYLESQSDLKVVAITLGPLELEGDKFKTVSEICRKKEFGLVHACQNGLFGKIFNDFGGLAKKQNNSSEFIVIDKDGEELQEVMIDSITEDSDGNGIVTLQKGFKHKYSDGDKVVIKEVVGMMRQEQMIGENESINETVHNVTQINPSQFKIENITAFSPYERNGIAKQVKVPRLVNFKEYKEFDWFEHENKSTEECGTPIDQNLMVADFEKIDNVKFSHWCYSSVLNLCPTHEQEHYDDFYVKLEEYVFDIAKTDKYDLEKQESLDKLKQFVYVFMATIKDYFQPINAYLGGIAAQEIIKAITQKFSPIQQLYYFDMSELYPESYQLMLPKDFNIPGKDRYCCLTHCLGAPNLSKLQNSKLFMIGAGAIGCELLKNYAMLGIGTKGKGSIILTDPDVIEVSNLNRQFLFREKHLRKPKSYTAAAASIQMNEDLKGRIDPRLDKIHDATEYIYDELFFKDQSIVTNALDNVQARLYIDAKCVAARIPLIDSGTLGPKGHVQVIIPYKTESYASQNDPEDNTQIPHCTLKMFPEETLHCVEWAKDIFGHLFALQSQNYNKMVVESDVGDTPNFGDQQEIVLLRKVFKTIEHAPKNFQDCIQQARLRFQRHFYNNIKQLLHVYPLDKSTKEGRLFWSLPKRPPHPVEFDPSNEMHKIFVSSCACLLAKIYNIEIPYDKPRSEESRIQIAKIAEEIKVPEFQVNDQKASEIEAQVEKEKKKGGESEESQIDEIKVDDITKLKEKYYDLIHPLKKSKKSPMRVEEFEKDEDDNFHIDFISSMANIRAMNYKLDLMDWLTVKIKAGRIIPALATTTAAIAGLQTIEMIRIILGRQVKENRNSFLNLAVPSLMMSEPGEPVKTKIKEGLEVTLWDRWESSQSTYSPLKGILEEFELVHGLEARDVFYGSVPIFMHAIQGQNPVEKAKIMNQTMSELLSLSNDAKFVDLTVTFVDPKAEKDKEGQEIMLQGIPKIRIQCSYDFFGEEY